MSRAELGISEDIVGVVRRELDTLGFDTSQAPTPSVGLVVHGSAADALLDRAAEYLLDDALGLTVASRIPIGSLGTLDYGLCTSSTLGDALRLVTRFYGVATQRARLQLVEDAQPARLVFLRLPDVTYSRHWVEFALGMIGGRMRQTVGGQLAFERVSFRHEPPPRTDAHDEYFGTRVEFGAEEDCIAVANISLDLSLHTASAALAELLERRMRELEPAMSATDVVVDRVRRTLVVMLGEGVTDLNTLATRLGESTRTLQRLLGERSTSHKMLLDELRRARAAELLDQGMRIADVAKRLGFSEASAFFRAYRRWTGTSPKSKR